MLAVAGATLMEVTVLAADCTMRVAEPLRPPSEAVTVTDPAAFALVNPVSLTDAIDPEFTVQVADEFTLVVEPSVYVAVAVNCCVCPD